MLKTKAILLLAVAAILLPAGCSKEKNQPAAKPKPRAASFDAERLLPPASETYALAPVGSYKIYRGDSLKAYVGQALAAEYELYGCLGMVASTYEVKKVPVSVEIAQFNSIEGAYGFYARLRPDGALSLDVGAESFRIGNTLYFTAGAYAVTLSVENDSLPSISAQSLVAQEISTGMGKLTIPQWFMLYPSADKLIPSNKYYPRDYLGVDSLDTVFTTTYVIGKDTAVFFLTVDLSGGKYLALHEFGAGFGKVADAPSSFLYYHGYSLAFRHPTYGRIVAGLVRGKLVGIVGYSDTFERLGSLWVQGLQ